MQQNPQDKGFQDPNKGDRDNKRFPFDKGKKHMKDNIVDPESNLIYQDKHWKPVEKLDPKKVDQMKEGKAPITEMLHAQICDGVLHLTGTFLEKHKEEIHNTVMNCEKLAKERDSMNQIENIEESKTGITIYTVKNQLAVIIGKKLDSAFKGGNLEIKWSKGDKPSEVRWHKDL